MNKSSAAEIMKIDRVVATRLPIRSVSISILLTMMLYGGAVILRDWYELIAMLLLFPCLLWIKLLVLCLSSYLIRFVRWHYLISTQNYKMPVLHNFEIYLAGFVLTLTPGKLGEAIRAVYLRPYGISYSNSLATLFVERLMDLGAVCVLALLGISIIPETPLLILIALIGLFAIKVLLHSNLFDLIVNRFIRGSANVEIKNILATVRFLLSGTRLGVAFFLSLFAWGAQGLALYYIVDSFGFNLGLIKVIAIYCVGILVGVLSLIPGGLLATEGTIVLLLIENGVSHSGALLSSIICRGLTLWLAIGIGCFCMSRCSLRYKSSFI
jgi:uncharacterized protein (TIRG00374 family)